MVLGVNNNYQNCSSPTDNAKSVIYLVSFKDITNGTTIDFTDNGWERLNPNFFGTTEGVIRLTRTGGMLPAGTVFRVALKSNVTPPLTPISGWSVTSLNSPNSLDIAIQDQLFIMQGGNWNTSGTHQGSYSGNLLLGYNTSTVWNSNGTTNHSNLPNELICYHQTYTSNSPMRRYSGSTTMVSHGEWLVRILNSVRWTAEGSCNSFNTNFNISSIPIRTTIPSQEICSGEPLDNLEVVNETNVAQYQWYSNNVPINTGGSLIPGANSHTFNPSNTTVGTTYYYCVMTIDLPLNGTANTTDCAFASNVFQVTVNPNPATSPVIPL